MVRCRGFHYQLIAGQLLRYRRWSFMVVLARRGRAMPLEALIERLPHAAGQTLEGQFHALTPDVLTPVLEKFFLA